MGNGFGGGVFDALTIPNGFLIRLDTVAAALLAQNLAERSCRYCQCPDAVSLRVIQRGVLRQGQRGGGLPAVPCDHFSPQGGGPAEIAFLVDDGLGQRADGADFVVDGLGPISRQYVGLFDGLVHGRLAGVEHQPSADPKTRHPKRA